MLPAAALCILLLLSLPAADARWAGAAADPAGRESRRKLLALPILGSVRLRCGSRSTITTNGGVRACASPRGRRDDEKLGTRVSPVPLPLSCCYK